MSHRPLIEDVALIATDFDGTLLGVDRKISERTRTILARLAASWITTSSTSRYLALCSRGFICPTMPPNCDAGGWER